MIIGHSKSLLRIYIAAALICLLAGAPSNTLANPQNLFQLIGERLSHMEDVALYKKTNNLAIEDLAREQLVIENAVAAAQAAGLNGDSVSGFFRNQIEVAKAIQYRSLANWISQPTARTAPDLISDIRPILTILGDRIVVELTEYLNEEHFIAEAERELFHRSINVANVSDSDKDLLFDSLKLIRSQ